MVSNDKNIFNIGFDELPVRLKPQFGEDTQRIINTYRNTRPGASAVDILVAIQSINMMGLGSIIIAERKTKQKGAPAYLYNFGYKSDNKVPGTDYPMGTPHAMDISFKFYMSSLRKTVLLVQAIGEVRDLKDLLLHTILQSCGQHLHGPASLLPKGPRNGRHITSWTARQCVLTQNVK
jgi:hypothetical protein